MAELTQKQFEELLAARLAEEANQPAQVWYLSFASEEDFLGGAIVYARGPVTARTALTARRINPGGQCMIIPIPPEYVPAESYFNRLLTLDELKTFWPDMTKLGELELEDEQG
jgi:hypothetical protein